MTERELELEVEKLENQNAELVHLLADVNVLLVALKKKTVIRNGRIIHIGPAFIDDETRLLKGENNGGRKEKSNHHRLG